MPFIFISFFFILSIFSSSLCSASYSRYSSVISVLDTEAQASRRNSEIVDRWRKSARKEKKSLFLLWSPKTNDRTNWEAAAAAKKTSLRLDVTVLYSIGSSNCYRNGEKKTAAHTQKILESKMGEKKKSMRNKWYQTNQMRQVKMVAGIKLEYNTKIKCIYLITYCFPDASCSIKKRDPTHSKEIQATR